MTTHESGGLPCPFCESTATRLAEHSAGGWAMVCDSCEATGPRARESIQALARWQKPLDSARLLRTVIDESPDVILMKDWNGRFLLGNATLANLYGTSTDQLVGKDDGAFNPNAEQVAFYLENVRGVMRSGKTEIVQESSTNTETGEVRHYQSIKKPLRGPNGERRILVIAHDVTELQRAHQIIEERERSYDYAMAAAGEGIWDWDLRTNLVTHNERWCELLGFPATERQHQIDVFGQLLHEDDRAVVQASLEEALLGSGAYAHEHRMRRRDGKIIWVLDRGKVVERDTEGRPVRMAGSATDISERKRGEQALLDATDALARANATLEIKVAERTAELARANQELRELARRDALTGLPNRLAGNERLHDEFVRMKRTRQPNGVLMMDIDHFKEINDAYGHDGGDNVLRHIAVVLRDALRESDFVARFGGEEFLAVLPNTTAEGALVVGEKVRHTVESRIAPIGRRLTISISIGMALAQHSHPNPDVAVRMADRGLYEAKRSGRNRLIASADSPA